ncbi:MAG: chemotaxis protein CheX [Sphingomonadaceae bacterium]
MNSKVIERFVNSGRAVLSTELGAQIGVGQLSAQKDNYVTQDVTALVGVTGELRGMVIFGLSKETALALVSHMMGQEFRELDAVAESGIAELGNVVVGSAVTSLAEFGYKCGITPPAVVLGSNTVISTPNLHRLVFPLLTPSGTIEMQLALRENGVR